MNFPTCLQIPGFLGLLALCLLPTKGEARKLPNWNYTSLTEASDFVAIVLVEKTELSDIPLADSLSPKLFQGYKANSRLLLLIKGESNKDSVTFLFYRNSSLKTFDLGESYFAKIETGSQYLVFLKKTSSGFGPTSGDLDSGYSFKKLEFTDKEQ